jgi:uncharacterized protein YbbK (DUF523 family)
VDKLANVKRAKTETYNLFAEMNKTTLSICPELAVGLLKQTSVSFIAASHRTSKIHVVLETASIVPVAQSFVSSSSALINFKSYNVSGSVILARKYPGCNAH